MRSTGFLVAAALAFGASADATPRAGKVVRVERKAAGVTGQPRFCSVQPVDMFGNCVGSRAPEVGERMVAVDHNRVVGTLRVTQVQPYADGCQQTNNWMIQTVADGGDFGAARGIVLGLSDVNIDIRTGRLINVDKTPTGHPWGTDQIYAVDSNGDGNADVEFIQFQCDDFGNASNNATSSCFEVWAAQANRSMERLRQDRFRVCY